MDIPVPENDAKRAAVLRSYNILDTAPEPAYDDITALAAKICDCPQARIQLIDESRLWRKSTYGSSNQGTESPREETICFSSIFGTEPLIVPDLTKDERFSDYPNWKRHGTRFYFGMPLINPQGFALGTLCVFDTKPRELTAEQQQAVRQLAGQVIREMELRRLLVEAEIMKQTLEEKVREQVSEIERVSRFRRFLSPQIAETILKAESGDLFKTHRREVTVAFIDLRGFTNFSDSAEPEEVIDFLKCYHAEIGRMVFQYEGSIEHFAGDGVMAFFGDPIPRDDHTEMAVRMAVEMQTRGKDLCKEWCDKGYNLEIGIGLAAGYATMGTIGFEGRMDYGAVGNVTILASRLSSEAKGGQILTNQKTLCKIEDLVVAEPLGELHLKGFARPVAVFNITKLKE